MTYDAAGNVSTVTRYADLAGTQVVAWTAYGYDADGRVTGLWQHDANLVVPAYYAYGYDLGGRLISETEGVTYQTYSYDADNQLLSDGVVTHSYDANGNRTDAGYATGTGNQVTSDGTWTYTYDAAGNLIKKSKGSAAETWTYGYDNANQMTWAEDRATDGGTLLQRLDYTYDVDGQRLSMAVTVNGVTTTTRYAYDGANAWADLDGSNALVTRQLFGNMVDQLFAQESAGGTPSWYLTDRQGSTRLVVDNSGTVQDAVTYNGFTQVVSESNPSAGFNYQFQGGLLDRSTGFVLYGKRYLNPVTMCWTSEDPIGFTAGDMNLYRDVGNAPTDGTDPNGTELFITGDGGAKAKAFFNDNHLTYRFEPFADWATLQTDPSITGDSVNLVVVSPDSLDTLKKLNDEKKLPAEYQGVLAWNYHTVVGNTGGPSSVTFYRKGSTLPEDAKKPFIRLSEPEDVNLILRYHFEMGYGDRELEAAKIIYNSRNFGQTSNFSRAILKSSKGSLPSIQDLLNKADFIGAITKFKDGVRRYPAYAGGTFFEAFLDRYTEGEFAGLLGKLGIDVPSDLKELVSALRKSIEKDDYRHLALYLGDKLLDSTVSDEDIRVILKESLHAGVLGRSPRWDKVIPAVANTLEPGLGDLITLIWNDKKLGQGQLDDVEKLLKKYSGNSDVTAAIKELNESTGKDRARSIIKLLEEKVDKRFGALTSVLELRDAIDGKDEAAAVKAATELVAKIRTDLLPGGEQFDKVRSGLGEVEAFLRKVQPYANFTTEVKGAVQDLRAAGNIRGGPEAIADANAAVPRARDAFVRLANAARKLDNGGNNPFLREVAQLFDKVAQDKRLLLLAVGVAAAVNTVDDTSRPVFEVDWSDRKQRAWAENWWQAQQAGYPTVVTWAPSLEARNRRAAQAILRGSIKNARFKISPTVRELGSPDEYPPCSTRECGEGAWIGHVPIQAQKNQGGHLQAWVRSVGLMEGDKFKIRIINRPPNPSPDELPMENK